MKTIRFTVVGLPIPKGRPRFSTFGKFVRTYTPRRTHNAEKAIVDAFKSYNPKFKTPANCPIRLYVKFFMPIPCGTSKKKKELLLKAHAHLKRPDLDNLLKTVCDALNGLAWTDDSWIVTIFTTKEYGIEPRTEVKIKYLTNV